jgi:hypothetical protein
VTGAKDSVVGSNNVHQTGEPTGVTFCPGIYLAGTVRGTVWGSNVHQNLYGMVVWVDPWFVEFGADTATKPTLAKNNLHRNTIQNLWIIP